MFPATTLSNSLNSGVDISILIVCYQSLDLIGPTLDGVFKYTRDCRYEVLLTDCSDDGTEAWVAEHYPSVRIIAAGGNLGFAAGNNLLARHAAGKYLLLLNPDVIVHDNAIGHLHRCALENPSAGGWGGQTNLPDGRVDPGSQQSIPNLRRLAMAAIGQEKRTVGGLRHDTPSPQAVDGLSGAFLMVRRDRWDLVGGFDESFFMYAEELDLCYRLSRLGHPMMMTADAQITHLVGSGSALNPRRSTSIARAKMHFLRKHRGQTYAGVAAVLYWIGAVNRVAQGAILGGLFRRDRPRQLLRAYWPVATNPTSWVGGYPPEANASESEQSTPEKLGTEKPESGTAS